MLFYLYIGAFGIHNGGNLLFINKFRENLLNFKKQKKKKLHIFH